MQGICYDVESYGALMHNLLMILVLLLVTSCSSVFVRIVPFMPPLPLVQIALGAVGALCGLEIGFNPDVFLLLFIPPLLFADAYRMPLREFGELRGMILTLAIGLVVFATLGGGYFIHWLIPTLMLPVCFALAAVLSPTDAVAVGSMIEGGKAPRRIVHLLQGEALLNDASGLVCFKFAVAAAMTGMFSVKTAIWQFLFIAVGGLVVGFIIAYTACWIEKMLIRYGKENSPTSISLAILLPFFIYLVAEHLGCSGILGAVAGGMTVKMTGVMREAESSTRLQATTVWDMVTFIFNGLIFMMLGLQLPHMTESGIALAERAGISPWWILVAIIAVQLSMLVMRFTWVWLVVITKWVVYKIRGLQTIIPTWRGTLLLTAAGVRGAVTLAAVLSLPIATAAAQGFPNRELVVTIATGDIISSLIFATLVIPPLVRGMGTEEVSPLQKEIDRTRATLVRTAVRTMQEEQAEITANGPPSGAEDELKLEVVSFLLQDYQNFLKQLDDNPDAVASVREGAIKRGRLELAIRLSVLRTLRSKLRSLHNAQYISDETETILMQEIDYEEQELHSRARMLPRIAEVKENAVA